MYFEMFELICHRNCEYTKSDDVFVTHMEYRPDVILLALLMGAVINKKRQLKV